MNPSLIRGVCKHNCIYTSTTCHNLHQQPDVCVNKYFRLKYFWLVVVLVEKCRPHQKYFLPFTDWLWSPWDWSEQGSWYPQYMKIMDIHGFHQGSSLHSIINDKIFWWFSPQCCQDEDNNTETFYCRLIITESSWLMI